MKSGSRVSRVLPDSLSEAQDPACECLPESLLPRSEVLGLIPERRLARVLPQRLEKRTRRPLFGGPESGIQVLRFLFQRK